MPSILRQAIGAIKDQTSIGIAKFSKRSANLEVAVLKATSHDEIPIEERHLTEVLLLSATSSSSADACVQTLSRRISRTSNWVVALKTLVVVFRLLRNGGSQFIHEALAARPGSHRLLDLSNFSDHYATFSPWDYTAFIRTFAVYLDARLESALLGKLSNLGRRRPFAAANVFTNMKTPLILEHIEHWQRLLDRAIGTRPTGPAKTNRLVLIALYLVICETFNLYRDISNGLSLLLDNFFHLQHAACLKTFQACMMASQQFEELESFYDLCKKIGVGRMSEYPSVQKISATLLKALEEFLKHRPDSLTTSPNTNLKSTPPKMIVSAILKQKLKDQESETMKGRRRSTGETMSQWESAMADHKDLQLQKISSSNNISNGENCAVKDIVLVDDQQKASNDSDPDGWEILLVTSIKDMSNIDSVKGPKTMPSETLLNQKTANQPDNFHNPFLHSNEKKSLAMMPASPRSPIPPPTFQAKKPSEELAYEEDHFSASFNICSSNSAQRIDTLMVQQRVLREQHVWMQQQSKIIAKTLAC